MNYQRTLRIYEWISYILIIAATVVYFILHSRGAGALNLTLCILVLAVFCRLMMERTRRQAADAENDELKLKAVPIYDYLTKQAGFQDEASPTNRLIFSEGTRPFKPVWDDHLIIPEEEGA